MAPAISQSQALVFASDEKDSSDVFQQTVSHVEKSEFHLDKKAVIGHKNIVDSNSPASIFNQNTSFSGNNSLMARGVQDSVDRKLFRKLELNNELKDIVELVGCYVHPVPISSLFLSTKGNEICICVSCGLLMDRDRNLFIYKIAIEEPRVGCPSFVGHTSITLPVSKDCFGREVELERSGLHFTPDGQHLVLLNSIKTPRCSAQTQEFILPANNNYTSPGLMELNGIPKCASLVVGHNGAGEFSICNSNVEEHINGIMAATKMWFSENSVKNSFLSFEGEDIAVWLLVSTISDSDARRNFIPSYCQNNSVGGWRLALLVKDKVVLGCALDPRASAVGASAGHGIIGTCDGLAYMWELATGTKLGSLHHFKGGSISCVAIDDSGAGALAVATDGGQLLVYLQILHAQKNLSN